MSSLVNFESSRTKKQERQQLKEARNHYLDKAKEEYERSERRKESRKQQVDDTWMLPSLSQLIDKQTAKIESVKHKKKKKEKKHKKEKKKKKKHKKQSDSGSEEDSSEDEPMWVEKSCEAGSSTSTPQAIVKGAAMPPTQRDSWMEAPLDLMSGVTRQQLRDEKKKQDDEATAKNSDSLDQAGQHVKELNPYWKDGGKGLPDQNKTSKAPTPALGDGGVKWLKLAYQRCVEQAEEEGRPLEELAKQRWGSIEKIETMIMEAERAQQMNDDEQQEKRRNEREQHHKERYNEDRHRHDRHRHSPDSRSHRYSNDLRSDRYRDRSPARRKGQLPDDRNKDDDQSPDRHRDRSSRDKNKDGSPARGKELSQKGHMEDNDQSPDRYRDRSSRDRYRDGSPARRKEHSSDGQDNDRSPDRYRDRSSRERHRDESPYRKREKNKERSPYSRSKGSPHRDRMSGEDSKMTKLRGLFRRPGDDVDRDTPSWKTQEEGGHHTGSWKKKSVFKPGSEDSYKNDVDILRAERNGDAEKRWKKEAPKPVKRESSSSSSDGESESSSSGSESEAERSAPPSVAVKILTETEMNQLGAKVLRAEMMGNQALADKLKQQLEDARKAKAEQPARSAETESSARGESEEVVLTRTDRSGMARPLAGREHTSEPQAKRRNKQKVSTHDKAGKRERYFADDDKHSLKAMFEAEKLGTAEDSDMMFARLAGKGIEKTDDEYQIDDVFVSRANKEMSASKQEERDRSLAIQEHRRTATALDKCTHCLDNTPKHLIIAIGTKVYLSLPSHKSMTEGHCLIVPIQHVTCSTALDEEVWAEIQAFRKSLTKMYESKDEDCIFLETAMKLRNQRHMVIECIPMEREIGDMAPIYFKKAIMECEQEWAQNKKVIDLKNRDVRRAVPKGFPYFSVDFGLQGGFAHVIEEEHSFPHYFGREIIGGMIDCDVRLWKKPPREYFEDQRQKVLNFAKSWKEFDFTNTEDQDT